MKAAFFSEHGGPEVLRVGEVPEPEVGRGQVKVRVRAVALNHIDLWLRVGLPKLKIPLPHVGGADIAGEIVSVDAAVSDLFPGDRVLVNPVLSCGRCVHCQAGRDNLCADYGLIGESRWGGAAEFIVVDALSLIRAPASVDDVHLCALPIVYMTAWHMLVNRARVEPSETVLVWAAGSGVGTAAIQIAKLYGARVLATASTEAKRVRAIELGADAAFDSADPDLIAKVKQATGGLGADVVFEHTGAATFNTSIRIAARGGRIVTCGATTGPKFELDIRHIFWRQLSILGATMAPRARLFRIVDLAAEGKLSPVVDRVLPLDQIAEAHRFLESRHAFGKVVLTL